ncbi:hypothetical protein ACFST9_18795 [Hymenobacter monticola]|uniref:DUF4279 domain-containing protein n=1 Tax=Hymenobacter monticola TaxID=1705399 RepID=A0ABY4AYR9_9BACT|nr:hypothetical protein [Hymenobacter monticola]UOE32045.1 hypothetical protein MTP16_12970 [Hymenobacter monticola]
MKYHHLSIFGDNTAETYQAITKILGVAPLEDEGRAFSKSEYSVWTYAVGTEDNQPYFDFINVFLDLLETKFDALEKLGIFRDNITFWLLYNYEHQCSLGFNAQELLRLGASGIALNIDCWEEKK